MNTVTKKKTTAEAAKAKAARTHDLVLVMLEWDEAQHFDFVIDRAKEYLKKQIGPDLIGQERLLSHPTFWSWWKNHFARRDEDFIDQCFNEADLANLHAYYKYIHSADRLQNIKPHKVVMERSYAKMLSKAGQEVKI